MAKPELRELVKDKPYHFDAYDFVMRALDYTIQSLHEVRHVSGRELVDGIQSFAKDEFGPMAKHVLNRWGVCSTRDFGVIVFDLVDQGVLKKTAEDRIEDFEERFDFASVFERDYYVDHPALRDGA